MLQLSRAKPGNPASYSIDGYMYVFLKTFYQWIELNVDDVNFVNGPDIA